MNGSDTWERGRGNYLLLLQKSQAVYGFKERVHDEWVASTILVELGDQIVNILLHLVLFLVSVSLLSVDVFNELSGLLDVVDGKVLAFHQQLNRLFGDGPLRFDNYGDTDPGKDEEPAECVQDQSQDKEVLVNEDGLLVLVDLAVHDNHHLSEANRGEDGHDIGRERPVRPIGDHNQAVDDAQNGVDRDQQLTFLYVSSALFKIQTNES